VGKWKSEVEVEKECEVERGSGGEKENYKWEVKA
jgi:hypothetical protein